MKKKLFTYTSIYFIWIVLRASGHPHGHRHHQKNLQECVTRLDSHEKVRNGSHEFQRSLNSEEMMATDTGEYTEAHNEPPYTLLINEVNLDNPGPNSRVFVEFEVITRQFPREPGKSDLDGFLFIMVRGNPLEIVLSVDLGAAIKTVNKNYLVIGKKGSEDVDIALDSSDVSSVFTGPVPFPDFDDSPYALIVIHSKLESVLADLSLEKDESDTYTSINLMQDERLRELISGNLVDMIVVARKAPTNHCTFFESLKPAALVDPNFKVMLRDWDGPTAQYSKDLSLSRCCGDKRPNDQDCWRLATPSAGAENRCEYRRPFYLESVINRISLANAVEEVMETDDGPCPADYPDVPSSRYSIIDDHTYAKALNDELEKSLQCPSMPTVAPASSAEEQAEEEMVVDDAVELPPTLPLQRFDSAAFEKCSKHLTDVTKINVPEITKWLEVTREGGKCKFKCSYCSFFLQKGFRPDEKQTSRIMTTGFFSGTNRSRNKAYILDHVNPDNHKSYSVHQQASDYVESLMQAKSMQNVREAEARAHAAQKLQFKPTMDSMRLSWAELRAEVSFRSHPIFVDTATDLGVNLGTSHTSHNSLRLYAKAFSDGFHRRLLKHLTDQNQQFSFMADATTNRNTGFLVCLIQTLEDGHPVLYFWKLVRLTKSESGLDMMEDLSRAVDEDETIYPGFKNYFKTNLIAFVSDRGSPMVGKHKGLIKQLIKYVNHDVISIPCSAHVTETAIKHALAVATSTPKGKEKPDQYYMKFGDYNNKFYTYFMSRGSKRWAHLQDVAEEIGLKPARIKYHHTIRWSKSKRMAMAALLKDFDAIRIELERASKAKGENADKAKALLLTISDKSFGSTLAEFVDMLSVSESLLNAFQKKHGIYLGLSNTLREAMKKYEVLKSSYGKNLRAFLSRMSCPGVCTEGSCTLWQYDSCPVVQYTPLSTTEDTNDYESAESTEESPIPSGNEDGDQGPRTNVLTLEEKDTKSVSLSLWRLVLYNRLISEMKKLFNFQKIESFEIFDPHHFEFSCPAPTGLSKCQLLDSCYRPFQPIHVGDVPQLAAAKMSSICTFYSIQADHCNQILDQWRSVLGHIIISQKYELISAKSTPADFWNFALRDSSLNWPAQLRTLLEKVLVTGQSSAAAERAFSILTRLRGSDRASLGADTLEDLVRLRFNGPDKIDNESLYEYTLIFLKDHKPVDFQQGTSQGDQNPQKTDRIPSDSSPASFKRSRIFSSLP